MFLVCDEMNWHQNALYCLLLCEDTVIEKLIAKLNGDVFDFFSSLTTNTFADLHWFIGYTLSSFGVKWPKNYYLQLNINYVFCNLAIYSF